ncbi:beta-1,3-glucan-binding protein-like [Vanessa tameamea]|uniref:Beta-1,3-glucan-binding protein-like n=1 Tax=Vanessa tameamea TaxID=334116 RepID=A0A8B8ID54_VANTA
MTSKVIAFLFVFILSVQGGFDDWKYETPTRSIQALKPKGLRVFLPGDPRIKLFLFEGYIQNDTQNTSVFLNKRDFWGFGQKQKNRDGWIFEDRNIALEVGQTIVHRSFVSIGNPFIKTNGTNKDALLQLAGYYSPMGIFTVEVLEDPAARGAHCPETATKVRGGYACAQEVIFEDNFDNFREDLWQIEQYIPFNHPEHPFVSYQRPLSSDSNSNIFIENGFLNIVPKLQQDILKQKNESIQTGALDLLSGCTGDTCVMKATGVNVLPPIVSGRLTSARFAFTYGTIYIRAKLPRGDWIYPEILLESSTKKYGSLNYASGLLKVVLSRGNVDTNSRHHSIHEISGGPVINAKCRDSLEFYYKKMSEGYWSDDFHEYALQWTPERISLDVDGVNFATYLPGPAGLRAWLPQSCRGEWYQLFRNASAMAPFDHHFQIALGVAVGGTMEFPDGLKSGGKPKPWNNRGRKATLSFWQDKENWLPTWTQPGLVVDYVKVVAL